MREKPYTVSQLVKIFGKTRQTIHNWIDDGRFPNSYIVGEGGGKVMLIPQSDVEKVRQEEANKLKNRLKMLGYDIILRRKSG